MLLATNLCSSDNFLSQFYSYPLQPDPRRSFSGSQFYSYLSILDFYSICAKLSLLRRKGIRTANYLRSPFLFYYPRPPFSLHPHFLNLNRKLSSKTTPHNAVMIGHNSIVGSCVPSFFKFPPQLLHPTSLRNCYATSA
jgi:hypothetical protein